MTLITIKLKSSNESAFSIEIDTDKTILDLKKAIAHLQSATPDVYRLIFAGRVLKDEETIVSYKIQDGNTIHMLKSAPKPSPSSTTTSTPSPTVETPRAESTPTNPTPAPAPAMNPFAALAGMGMGGQGMQGMGGLPPMDPSLLNSLLSNPQTMAQMSQMMSTPGLFESIINSNPQTAQMPPQQREFMRSMMSNPQFLSMMMGSLSGMAPPMNTPTTPNAAQTPSGMPPLPMPFMNPALASAFMNPASFTPTSNTTQSQEPPEVLYQTQLGQLQDMGFFDAGENIRALTMTGGNVNAAVEWLFSHPPGGL